MVARARVVSPVRKVPPVTRSMSKVPKRSQKEYNKRFFLSPSPPPTLPPRQRAEWSTFHTDGELEKQRRARKAARDVMTSFDEAFEVGSRYLEDLLTHFEGFAYTEQFQGAFMNEFIPNYMKKRAVPDRISLDFRQRLHYFPDMGEMHKASYHVFLREMKYFE